MAGAQRTVLAAVAIGFGLRALAFQGALPGAWGLDTFQHLPRGWAPALVLLGAIGFVPGVRPAIAAALDRLGGAWEKAGLRLDAALAAGAGVCLFALRDPIRFVGDADARYAQLFNDAPASRVFPQATALDRLVNIEAGRALVRLGAPAELATQVVPALLGALLVLALFAFLRAADTPRGDRVAIAAFLLGSAIPIHMAGYGKFGLMLLGIALAAIGVELMTREGRGAALLGLGAALAVLAHRSGLLLLPACGAALFLAWRHSASAVERREVGWGTVLVAAAALIEWPHAVDALWRVDRVTHLAGGAARAVEGGFMAPASTALQNLFYILPAWFAGVAAVVALSVRRREKEGRFGLGGVASLAGGVAVLQLLLVRGTQGEVRDWDMHLGPVLIFGLLGAHSLIRLSRTPAGAAAPLATTALASSIALWSIHANPLVFYARIDAQLERAALWTDSERARTYDLLGMRAVVLGAPATAVRYLEAAVAIAPSPRFLCELGAALRMAGRPADAEERYRQAQRRDPNNPDPWLGLGALALDRRDFDAALDCARRATALEPDRRDARELERLALEGAAGGPARPRGR